MRLPSPAVTGSLLGALFCAAPRPFANPAVAPARAPIPAPVAAGKPTLLVFITVDQMREDYLDRWAGEFIGGGRPVPEGGASFTQGGRAFVPNGHQDPAIPETAPGHASTMSGRFPRSTGITSNLAGVNDSTWPLIGSPGLGAAPVRFRRTTVHDWLP